MSQLILIFMTALFSASASAAPIRYFVGTYTDQTPSRGIYTGEFDPATGKLGPLTLAAEAPDPNFLALSADGRFLYAALGLAHHDAVASYAVEPGGVLRELNREPAQGSGVCYVSLGVLGRYLFIANYSSRKKRMPIPFTPARTMPSSIPAISVPTVSGFSAWMRGREHFRRPTRPLPPCRPGRGRAISLSAGMASSPTAPTSSTPR
jgi:hypothetical protein